MLLIHAIFYLTKEFVFFFRDNFILLHGIMGSLGFYMLQDQINLPIWDLRGFLAIIILHITISEPLYYFLHKCFHGKYLFNNYHSLHHSSPVPQPYTGNFIFFSY